MLRMMLVFCVMYLLEVASLPVSNRQPRSVAGKSNEKDDQPYFQSFFHPYIKELYQKITYENGSLIKNNLGDDPITVYSFLDIGRHFCMRLNHYRT